MQVVAMHVRFFQIHTVQNRLGEVAPWEFAVTHPCAGQVGSVEVDVFDRPEPAVEGSAGKFGPREVGAMQRAGPIRITERRAFCFDFAQVGIGQVGIFGIRAEQLRATQVRRMDPRVLENCFAQVGKLEIVTSTITLAETLYLVKDERPVPVATREKLKRLFENEFILLAEVDRRTAELAQEVVWDHDVAAKDAIHVATAVIVGRRLPIQQLDTFDGPLTERSGKVQGLQIGYPNFQIDLMTDAAENGAGTVRDSTQASPGNFGAP